MCIIHSNASKSSCIDIQYQLKCILYISMLSEDLEMKYNSTSIVILIIIHLYIPIKYLELK